MTGDRLAVDVAEAARLLSWNETGVWGAIKDGRLRSFKLGKRRLISRAALAAFVKRRELLDNRPVGPRPKTNRAASSAAGRGRTARTKKSAV